jgi:hypothetical protein
MQQRFTKPIQRLVGRIDRNTRGLAKLRSAHSYLVDEFADPRGALERLDSAEFDLIQERRNLRAQLEDEIRKQREAVQ